MASDRTDDRELQKLEAELDQEMRFRPLRPVAGWIVGALLLGLSFFHYYTAGFGLLPETIHRSVHIASVLGLIFLVFPGRPHLGGTTASFALPAFALLICGVLAFLIGCGVAPFEDLGPSLGRARPLVVMVGVGLIVVSTWIIPGARAPRSAPLTPLGIPLPDWLLAIAAAVSALYVAYLFNFDAESFAFRVGNPSVTDWAMGTIMILLMLEATRRSVGWPLPVIAIVLMTYAFWGQIRFMPQTFQHPGYAWPAIVNHLYLTSQGIYGVALGVVSTYVFHYVLFGVLATRVGLGRLFIDLAVALAGRFAGGPAKVSIFGSGLFGMISGSSIANTVTVGSLTIPMMIRLGYPRHFAGAVEAAAATGGQITPPIMGAAAFLMVEFLALPYQTIVLAATVPAFMHFFGVFWQVHFEAKKLGMRALETSEHSVTGARKWLARLLWCAGLLTLMAIAWYLTPGLATLWAITVVAMGALVLFHTRASEVMRAGWPTAIPLLVLMMVLFSGFTPYLAAFWGITACVVVGLTKGSGIASAGFLVSLALLISLEEKASPIAELEFVRAIGLGGLSSWTGHLALIGLSAVVSAAFLLFAPERRTRLIDILDAFVTGAKYAIGVGAAAATVGVIIGIVTLTGVGFKLADIITFFAQSFAAFWGGYLPAQLFDAASLTLFFTLAMTAIVCILLGCGVPTTANYLIMVSIAQPALAKLGVEPLVSHFFVFYYGVLADITPPVALAAYAGASMAGADPFKTGNTAFRLGLAKALVPFVFVYSPAMLLVTKEFTWPVFIETTAGCLIGIVMLAAALTGYGLAHMPAWGRLLLFAASVLVIAPSRTATLLGLVLAVPVLIQQYTAWRRPDIEQPA